MRRRLMSIRTARVSQMREILLHRGIVFGVSTTRARRLMPRILYDATSASTWITRKTFWNRLRSLPEIARCEC